MKCRVAFGNAEGKAVKCRVAFGNAEGKAVKFRAAFGNVEGKAMDEAPRPTTPAGNSGLPS